MNNKLILLLLLFLPLITYSQNNVSNEINKIDSLISISDSLAANCICTVRKFNYFPTLDVLIEDYNFKYDSTYFKNFYGWYTYFVFFYLNKKTFFFISFCIGDNGYCTLIHKYYFDSEGKTILYNFDSDRLDTTYLKIFSKQISTYFNEDFEIINVLQKYGDDELKNMDVSIRFEVIDQYDYYLEYEKDFQTILDKYNIKL